MHRLILIFLTFFLGSSLNSQTIPIYDRYDDYEREIIIPKKEVPHVINFWAIWCKPCVQELPFFEEVSSKYKEQASFTFVSLDFLKDYDKKLVPFVKKHLSNHKVVLLADPKEQTWIDRVHKEWSGAIPITLVIYKDQVKFHEGTFNTSEELTDFIFD